MKIIALDVSLCATGIVFPDGSSDVLHPPKGMVGPARLDWWRQAIHNTLADAIFDGLTNIVIERPFVAGPGRGSSTLELGKLYGVIDLELLHHAPAIPVLWVPPATLKRYATGNGGASKAAMIVAAVMRWGYAGHDDNESDAIALWHYATAKLAGEVTV